MTPIDRIGDALRYIDAHLEEPMTTCQVAERFHFSPFYFHRAFGLIVGMPMAAYIQRRRLERACALLHGTDMPLPDIALACGYSTQQAFTRAFGRYAGITPGAYRAQGIAPQTETVEGLIRRFANRIRGGVLVHPRIIKRPALRIAGVSGDGDKTGEVWQAFEAIADRTAGRLSDSGYEVRLHHEGKQTVHVGYAVDGTAPQGEGLTVLTLPASQYASFDVYVAEGYGSENEAMMTWLMENDQGFDQGFLDGDPFVVEYYDERFHGEESGSIVEIWMPVVKKDG